MNWTTLCLILLSVLFIIVFLIKVIPILLSSLFSFAFSSDLIFKIHLFPPALHQLSFTSSNSTAINIDSISLIPKLSSGFLLLVFNSISLNIPSSSSFSSSSVSYEETSKNILGLHFQWCLFKLINLIHRLRIQIQILNIEFKEMNCQIHSLDIHFSPSQNPLCLSTKVSFESLELISQSRLKAKMSSSSLTLSLNICICTEIYPEMKTIQSIISRFQSSRKSFSSSSSTIPLFPMIQSLSFEYESCELFFEKYFYSLTLRHFYGNYSPLEIRWSLLTLQKINSSIFISSVSGALDYNYERLALTMESLSLESLEELLTIIMGSKGGNGEESSLQVFDTTLFVSVKEISLRGKRFYIFSPGNISFEISSDRQVFLTFSTIQISWNSVEMMTLHDVCLKMTDEKIKVKISSWTLSLKSQDVEKTFSQIHEDFSFLSSLHSSKQEPSSSLDLIIFYESSTIIYILDENVKFVLLSNNVSLVIRNYNESFQFSRTSLQINTSLCPLENIFELNEFIYQRHKDNKNDNISFQDLKVYWRPLIHYTLMNAVSSCGFSFQKTSQSSTQRSGKSSAKSFHFNIYIQWRSASLSILLQKHRLLLHLNSGSCERTEKNTRLRLPEILLDASSNKRLLFLSNAILSYHSHNSKPSSNYRLDITGVENDFNDRLEIALSLFEINLLHDFNFYEVFIGEGLRIVKWLKILHQKPWRDSYSSSSSPDIVFYVKKLLIELHDDPFEIKLKKNYELMEDETEESEKRKACLESKISELTKSHLVLPHYKVEQLFIELTKKNADIYIKRAMQYHAKSFKKSRLLTLNLSSLVLWIFADSSMTGKEAFETFVQKIDSESPWPDKMAFATSILRWIRLEFKSCTIFLRDFPQPLADFRHILMWGKIGFADEIPVLRSLRQELINVEPYEAIIVERSLVSTKMYHDLALDMEEFSGANGPCWEPVVSQLTLSLNKVFGTSCDPSPPLPWWDKYRYLLHGQLLVSVKLLKLFLHTSVDPYNTAEEIELTLNDSSFHWTNDGILKVGGNMDCFVRTASKYDDCQLLHFPNLLISIHFEWLCLGNPRDHHSVVPCHKMPEFIFKEHDTYSAFRSQNLNARLRIESLQSKRNPSKILMYSSTIRWMESLKWLFSGASRPIRRGNVFASETEINFRKPSFFRHLKSVKLSLSFKELTLEYWTSASMTKGFLLNISKGLSLSAKHSLKLLDVNDGLKHRLRSSWSTEHMNFELYKADIWFQSSFKTEGRERCVEKSFFFSLDNVKYSRDVEKKQEMENGVFPTHSIIVIGARGAWTEGNREMCFSLYDSWKRAHVLREQISSGYSMSLGVSESESSRYISDAPSKFCNQTEGELSLSNLATWKNSSCVESMLATTEGSHTPIVYSEDQSSDTKKKDMEARSACTLKDVLYKSWILKFINSQMVLKSKLSEGHVICSASKAEISQTIHLPVWKNQTYYSKISWSGSLESMQCFATVSPSEDIHKLKSDQISWLPIGIIEEREAPPTEVSELVGSGQSVGGVVGQTVGSVQEELQRIISRCKCQFFSVEYGQKSIEDLLKVLSPPPDQWASNYTDKIVNSFSLVHHDLNVCTNSLQYSVVLDVINNLILYTEPSIKSRTEKYLSMKYQLMLSNIEDQWKPITQLQNQIRQLICLSRQKEKAIYNLTNESKTDLSSLSSLENEGQTLKDSIISKSEELELRLRCIREFQLSFRSRQSPNYEDTARQFLRRKSEIFFSRAQWRLTENDGQLGIADASISNFFYTKNLARDDSTDHSLEMGYIYVKNLLPNQAYEDVLFPTELQRDAPLDRHPTLRVYCREKLPVGGISVKDHFEINLSPITINITHAFYFKIMHFCFPEKPEYEEIEKKKRKEKKQSNFYVASPLSKDDVEMMKNRGNQNKLFCYVKIPEVPFCVSYKGEKEKSQISDLTNFLLQIPNIEYHNVTWTWLDLFLAIKSTSKDSLISQLIKEKLKLRARGHKNEDKQQDNDDEKAKLLLGVSAVKTIIKK